MTSDSVNDLDGTRQAAPNHSARQASTAQTGLTDSVLPGRSALPIGLDSELRVVSGQSNIRSTSGLLRIGDNPRILHFKQLPDRIDPETEVRELHRAAVVTQSIAEIRPVPLYAWYPTRRLMVTNYIEHSETL